jgi:predicted enzyme related to lactoylglutathione lyase
MFFHETAKEVYMKIKLNSIMVSDQSKALQFYTNVLGFVTKNDIPAGEYRWLTVVSPEEPEGTELVLEPNVNPAAQTYQKAMYDSGIPLTAFAVDDVEKEVQRLNSQNVTIKTEPTNVGTAIIAMFDDTCGNLIQIYQEL